MISTQFIDVDGGLYKATEKHKSATPEVTPEPEVRDGTTIEVHGLDPSTTSDTVLMFFESKRRSGGGDVGNVQFDPDSYVAYVTFHSRDGECLVYLCTFCSVLRTQVRIHFLRFQSYVN